MKSILTASAATLMVLVFTAVAPAQQYGNSYPGGSYHSVPSQQYIQPAYPSNYGQPQIGGSFSYSTPSFGFGINVNPSYGSSFGIYSQPRYVPSYYPAPSFVPPHYHHHHHHHHGHGHW